MKKITRTYFCNKKIERFEKILEKRIPKFNNLQQYLNKKFGNNKYSYKETIELEKQFKIKHSTYIKKFNYAAINMRNKRFNELSNFYIEKTMKRIKPEHLLQIQAIRHTDSEIVDYFDNKIKYKNRSLMAYSPLRELKDIKNSTDIKVFKLKIKEFAETYYTSKEEYIFDCLLEERSFLYEYNIFGKELEQIGLIIGYSNHKQFEILMNCISSLYYKKFYTLQFDKLSPIFRKLLVNIMLDGKFSLGYNVGKVLLQIIEHMKLDYKEAKQLIFTYANVCSNVLSGIVTIDSYNLPFKHILNEEDWKYLIDEVIFIGNNTLTLGNLIKASRN